MGHRYIRQSFSQEKKNPWRAWPNILCDPVPRTGGLIFEEILMAKDSALASYPGMETAEQEQRKDQSSPSSSHVCFSTLMSLYKYSWAHSNFKKEEKELEAKERDNVQQSQQACGGGEGGEVG